MHVRIYEDRPTDCSGSARCLEFSLLYALKRPINTTVPTTSTGSLKSINQHHQHPAVPFHKKKRKEKVPRVKRGTKGPTRKI